MSPRKSARARWTASYVGDQRGRTAVVTGANTGIGFAVAKALAEHGATVVLACRDVSKAEAAAALMMERASRAEVQIAELDLASLDSVRAAAQRIRSEHSRLDLLINNAGIMWVPHGRTEDGFERHLGVNHLGHFALTGLLLDRLTAVPGARIVTVSSSGHKQGVVDIDDPHFSRRQYRPVAAYAQSKLANLLFTYELQRRLAANSSETVAVAAHPGACRTDLMRHSPLHIKIAASRHFRLLFSWLLHDARHGALPILRAAVDPTVNGGDYYGPDGWGEFTGYPALVESSVAARDSSVQARWWKESEQATGVKYKLSADASPNI